MPSTHAHPTCGRTGRLLRPALGAALATLVFARAAAAAPTERSTPAARATLQSAVGAMLQGDGRQARRLLGGLPEQGLSEADRRFRACMLCRLSGAGSATPPAAGASAAPAPRDMDEAETRLSARLAQLGLHAQLGTTGRLRDLMLWSRQTERTETVSLPEGPQTTRVTYLDGFLSQGWSNHLSCERVGTGGWATTAGLYVIVPGYESLDAEPFRVNFLAHESQHYADQHRYPKLQGWELEYRAKLVELAYADETREPTLSAFGANQGDDPADAHSYANRRVLAALRERLLLAQGDPLTALPRERLQHAAVAALKADSARRTPGAR